jgi:hypothetical protein
LRRYLKAALQLSVPPNVEARGIDTRVDATYPNGCCNDELCGVDAFHERVGFGYKNPSKIPYNRMD